MSIMPPLPSFDTTPDTIGVFGGYNHQMSISDGEWYDMKNMAAEKYPLAATRPKMAFTDFDDEDMVDITENDGIYVLSKKKTAITIPAAITARDHPDEWAELKSAEYWRLQWTHIFDSINPTVNFTQAEMTAVFGTGITQVDDSWEIAPYYDSDTHNFYVKYPHDSVSIPNYSHDWAYYSGGNDDAVKQYLRDKVSTAYDITYVPETDADRATAQGTTGNTMLFVHNVGSKACKINFKEDALLHRARVKLVPKGETPSLSNSIEATVIDTDSWAVDFTYKRRNQGSSTQTKTVECRYLLLNGEVTLSSSTTYDVYFSLNNGYETTVPALTTDRYETVNMTVADKTFYANTTQEIVTDTETIPITFGTIGETTAQIAIPHGDIPAYTGYLKEMLHIWKFTPTGPTDKVTLGETATGTRQTIKMGAEIVIFPEKLKYNTITKEVKQLEQSETVPISITMVDHNGEALGSATASKNEPTEPVHNQKWIDLNGEIPVFKRYSETSGMWATIQTYAKIHGTSDIWDEGDAVELETDKLSGYLVPAKNQKYFVIYKKVNGAILVPCAYKSSSGSYSKSETMTISRTLPDMDYITECNNRLWGCKYGLNSDGETINEIFASKLGDASNWHYFANTSIDSYYMSMGDSGKFTGATTFESNPIFFREDAIHRIYGSYPANFQLKTVKAAGVKDGSYKSIITMNDRVYYLGREGVYAYFGALPARISDQLGDEPFSRGLSGKLGHNLYMALYKGDNADLYVYNDKVTAWFKYDSFNADAFMECNGECFALCDNKIVGLTGQSGDIEDDFDWMLQTGNMGYVSPLKKYLHKVTIRMRMPIASRCAIEMNYDSEDKWTRCGEIRPTGEVRTLAIPIIPHRCDHFAYRLVGHGKAEIISITKYYREGNDYD